MFNLNSLKKNAALTAIFMLSSAFADYPLGLIGGNTTSPTQPYAAFVSSTGVATPITGLPTNDTVISQVVLNVSGQGLIGGSDIVPHVLYVAFVSPSGVASPPITGLPTGNVVSLAMNGSSRGLVGGQLFPFGQPGFAAIVSPGVPATLISINGGVGTGVISSVAINDNGQGILGGVKNSTALYLAVVSPSGIATDVTGAPAIGQIFGAAINASGQGLVGGRVNLSAAYAAFVSPSGVATPIAGLPSTGIIRGAALNDAGQGLIGGSLAVFPALGPMYAATISSNGVLTEITGLPAGQISDVAINSSGQGIMGGQEALTSGPAFAALVSPSGIATRINLGLANSTISAVAINNFGQGLIGGQEFSTGMAYAAIVSPSGIATRINLGITTGSIRAVAILPLLSQIPTGSLSGNNLKFANYINEFAPQDAFFFVPALFDGTLAQALESAAPTRNAISLYTASNNLFYLTTGLSNHIRNRSRYMRTSTQTYMAAAVSTNTWQADELLASSCLQKPKSCELIDSCEIDPCDERTNSIWFEALGALAYQKAQHQTPGFHPSTGGAILAYDGKVCDHTRMGVGVSYLYTHISEKKNAGHSNIKQEDLFVYGTWENRQFYLDLSLLGGLFQTNQVRKIHMTGFEFKSTSHPHGWQLLPHVEFGYHYTRPCGIEFTVNPFIMVDWANAWQHSYKEKGSGPFNAGQKSHYSSLLRTEASLRFYETVFFDCWDLVFQEKIGYVNVHSFRTGRVNAFLVGSPGSFTVTTLTGDQNLGVGEFAMIFAPHSSGLPTSTIFYQGEFGSKYQSHQLALELTWNF